MLEWHNPNFPVSAVFLLVITTLLLSIVGVIAELAVAQTLRLYHSQTGLMQLMVNYHAAAVSKAKATIAPTNPAWAANGLAGCAMTARVTIPTPAVPACPVYLVNGDGYLMRAYNYLGFRFYSVAFQDAPASNSHYVITFAYAAPNGDIFLPDTGGRDVGYTIRDLNSQFVRAATPNLIYGSVAAANGQNYIATPASVGGYVLPAPNWIPANSLALISLVN